MRRITIFANDSVRLQTAPTGLMEYASDNRFRERLGAVTNRTYRSWRVPKLTLMVRLQTAPTGNGEN